MQDVKKEQSSYETLPFAQDINIIFLHNYPKSYHMHWHKAVEIMYYPKSAKSEHNPVFKINQDTYAMNPGDILFAWPGELHEAVDNSEGQIIGLQFSPTIFTEMPDFATYIHLFRSYHLIDSETKSDLAQNIAEHIDAILQIWADEQPFTNTRMLITLYELFMELGLYLRDNFACEFGQKSMEANKTFARISDACRYIQENCDQMLTLQTVSDYVGFSTYYFSRVFKSLTSTSFLEYLTMQRIKKAQSLLADSSLSITDIAYQSGYTSISTFNRVFRKSRGCSPTEYRKYYI